MSLGEPDRTPLSAHRCLHTPGPLVRSQYRGGGKAIADVQRNALLAERLNNHLFVRMRLVRTESTCVGATGVEIRSVPLISPTVWYCDEQA